MTINSKVSGVSEANDMSELMFALTASVISFMARTGMSDAAIRSLVSRCMRDSKSGKKGALLSRRGRVAYGCDTVAGAVLRAWHKLPQYLDESANPVPLKLDGAEPNLRTLILSQDMEAVPGELLKSMREARLVRKSGVARYLPTKDSATIGSLDPLAIDHIAKTIMRLVETATGNIDATRRGPRLIERYAHVPDLDESEVKAFAAFSEQQGQACLDSIEDWLEARQLGRQRQRRAVRKAVNAGVHIFAYVGESRREKVLTGKGRSATPNPPATHA